jgi:hypothetical protein
MYFDDHAPPHFHAFYGGDEAVVDFSHLSLVRGRLQPRALGMVMEWASLHQADLAEAWRLASTEQLPGSIEPLP